MYYVNEPSIEPYAYEPRKVATLDHPRRVNNKNSQFLQSPTSTLNSRIERLDINTSDAPSQFNQSYSSAVNQGTFDRFSKQHSPSALSSRNSYNDEHFNKSNSSHLNDKEPYTDSDFSNTTKTTNFNSSSLKKKDSNDKNEVFKSMFLKIKFI